MKIKKLLWIVIVLLISVFILAGCGAEKEEEKKDKNKEVDKPIEDKDANEYSNVGNFVSYKGNTYYWRLAAGSREDTALWGNFGIKIGYKNNLVSADSAGNESVILTDTGNGKIYIAKDRIFYQLNENGEYNIYSVDMNGNNKKSLGKGEIKYADRNYIYAQANNNLSIINMEQESATTYNNIDLIGAAGDVPFYISGDSSKEIKIGFIKDGEVHGYLGEPIATFSTSEYKVTDASNANITLYGFAYVNGKVKIKVGDMQGTGHFIQEGWIIEMDPDGKNVSKKQDDSIQEGGESYMDTTDTEVSYNSDKGLVYKEVLSDVEQTIISNDKIKSELGLNADPSDGETSIFVYASDTIGQKIYMVVDSGTHDPSGDVGWRYSYKRTKTVVFSYNKDTQKIEKLYEF